MSVAELAYVGEPTREVLGDFAGVSCLRAVLLGMEFTFGAATAQVALRAAGRRHGSELARQLRVTPDTPATVVRDRLDLALGVHGSRLCVVQHVEWQAPGERASGAWRVVLGEMASTATEPWGSRRRCPFTLGVVEAVLQAASHRPLCASEGGVSDDPSWDEFTVRERV